MDAIDKKILSFLKNDARMPFLHIAKELKMSEGAIRQRVSKMIKNSEIKRFTTEVANKTAAIIEITTSSKIPTSKIVEKMVKLGIDRIFEVTGEFSIVAMIDAESLSQLNEKVEQIRSIEGITQTETYPVLKEL